MSSFLNTTDVKRWLKLGATDAVIENLVVTDTIIIPSEIPLTDVLINKQTNIGEVNIVCLDDTEFNLQTATNGNIGDVLKTDGNGNTYWGVAGGIGSGIVYNGTLPIPVGQHTIISVDGLELTQSVINESATNLDVNGLNITNANDINAYQLKNISGNVLYFNTDDNITILNNQALLTTKTTFTEDQELVSKNYVDNNIGSGVVFNGTTPIAEDGHHTTISIDGLGLNLSKLIETTNDLNMGGLDIFGAGIMNCDDIQTEDYFSLNQELQKTDNFGPSSTGLTDIVGVLEVDSVGTNEIYNKDNAANLIQFPNNEDAIKVNTDNFLLNGVQIATIDDIPISSNPTFQDVYNNSLPPIEITLVYGKNIKFETEDSDNILSIYANTNSGSDFGITAERASLGFLNSTTSTSGSFIKTGGTSQQYLMADGSISDKFNQNLNTNDNVQFKKVIVTNAIIDNDQLTTKFYVDDAISATTQDFQSVYDTSSNPAIIEMSGKNINYKRSDNPILTIDGFNYKLTSQDVSVAQITSNNYFPPNSNNQDNWSLSPYIFTATASSFINFSHTPGTSFTYVAVGSTDGWISANSKYDVNSGAAITATSTLVGGSPVIGEWLQLFTSIAVAINGFYYGGLSNTLENDIAVDFQLVGSNDGTNFTLLSTQTAQDILYPGKQYILAAPTIPYNYFRFIIQSIKPNNLEGRCAVGSGTAFDIIPTNPAKIRILDDAIDIDGSYLTATNFIKQGGTNQQYLMADGSISAKFNQNLNTTDNVSFNSVALTAAITTNTQATTKLYVDNKVGTVAITSTDNNLLGVVGVSPTFSLTPKYTYAITFGGNNNNTTSQWLLPGSVRTSTISNTNVSTHQALIPINSTLVWASIQRTTTTGSCSLAYSVSNGAAVPITPILTSGQAQNPVPYPLNVNISAGGNLAISILSSVLSGNTIVSLLLRSN